MPPSATVTTSRKQFQPSVCEVKIQKVCKRLLVLTSFTHFFVTAPFWDPVRTDYDLLPKTACSTVTAANC